MTTTPMHEFYNEGEESRRHLTALGRLEFYRTVDILARCIPEPPARVADVGGGPGRFAFALAERGYDVDLVDVVPIHVQDARDRQQQQSIARVSVHEADARALPFSSGHADVVLSFGPMYHLTEWEDRRQCLAEARRILKPRGLLMVMVIPPGASFFGRLFYSDEMEQMEKLQRRLFSTGVHDATVAEEWLQTAYYHTASGIQAELATSGFETVKVMSVEGPYRYIKNLDRILEDEPRRDRLLSMLRYVEGDTGLFSISPHLMVMSRAR